jgi:adenylate cyclase
MKTADEALIPMRMQEAPMRRNTRERLDEMLGAMIERPEDRTALAAQIEAEFCETRAVMILDMSGFSRTTQRRGIVAFLLMIHQLRLLARPCIEDAGGLVVKQEADDLFCMFPDVLSAVKAARDITARLATVNLVLPEDQRLYAAMGIGYGPILNVDEEDLFGDQVNLASKLGEDIAEGGQILLTAAAHEQAHAAGVKTRMHGGSVSGLTFNYFEVI